MIRFGHACFALLVLLASTPIKASNNEDPGARGSDQCRQAYEVLGIGPYRQGTTEIPDEVRAFVPTGLGRGRLFYIDSGGHAHIFRFESEGGEARIIRVYYRGVENDDWLGIGIYNEDVQLYRMMSSLSQGGNDHFRYPNVLSHDDANKTFQFSDIQGHEVRSVYQALKDSFPDAASELVRLYNERYDNLRDELVAAGWTVQTLPPQLGVFRQYDFRRGELSFGLDIGNVVVNLNTLQMTVVDPG